MIFDHYEGSKGRESILRFGEKTKAQIVFLAPFFEEANRMRRPIVSIMREVAEAGFGTVLPDLPGCGESTVDLSDVELSDWRTSLAAFRKTIAGPVLVASFRSAAIIDDALNGNHYWRCAPENGQRLIRDLMRTRLTGSNADQETGEHIILAGNKIRKLLVSDLEAASPISPTSLYTAQLETSAAPADIRLPGSPLWRRSEPGEDAVLQDAITKSIITWAKTCVS